jgi:transglutaminase-like putative cysteine protease
MYFAAELSNPPKRIFPFMAATIPGAYFHAGYDSSDLALASRRNAANPLSIEYEALPNGTDGTNRTLDVMREAVLGYLAPDYSGYQSPDIQQAALQISELGAGHMPYGAVTALFDFCRDEILYIDHPWNLQIVQDAKRTLQLRRGDCVSKSVCLATLLACLGYISRFVAQCPDGVGFDHVYVELDTGQSQWLSLDPTGDGRDGRPLASIGWFRRLPDVGCETTKAIF